jgi:spore coat polysaccharide biosynthesis predicted glycosyltransferase SpsG
MASRVEGIALFRVAGGATIGFGHVMRVLSLARALGVAPRLSVRGSARARAIAASRGAVLDPCTRARDLAGAGVRLLVVDDPSARAAHAWVAAARRAGTPSVSLHDLGLAPVASDLAVDGSIARLRTVWPAQRVLAGEKYAVLDPEIARLRTRGLQGRGPRRVIVALGGGATGLAGIAVGAALKEVLPEVAVVVAPGFVVQKERNGSVPAIAPAAFRRELARSTVAVVGGGVSLAEACALGAAAVGVAVVPSQVPTLRACARRGIALDGGRLQGASNAAIAAVVRRVAGRVSRLLDDEPERQRLVRRAMQAIDARGAERVARAIWRLAGRESLRDRAAGRVRGRSVDGRTIA